MFSTIDLCKEKCFKSNFVFPLPLFALLVLIAFIFIVYFYVKTIRYSYYSLITLKEHIQNAKDKVKRVLRVIRDRPEYMDNLLLVLNSLLFGLGSWIAITGLWLETPVLIHHLPEGWSLASYLTFAIQLANIAPLIYWFLHRKFSKYCNEVSATNLQLFTGVLGSIVLIFYWDTQAYVFGGQHSVVLLACAFLLSIVDCLSSVTFLPFMARFRSVYLTPYLIGEALSGFLPTILAILQNVEDQYNPPDEELVQANVTDADGNSTLLLVNLTTTFKNYSNHGLNKMEQVAFGPEIFFVSLLVTLVISWIAFFYLQFHQPNHFERRNSLPLPPKKRSPATALSKYILGYDAEQRKAEEERWEKRKQQICQQERMNKKVKRIVKENQHLLKANSHVTIVPSNCPTALDAISTASFTAIKSASKPLVKEIHHPHHPLTATTCTTTTTLQMNRMNRHGTKRFNREKFEYYYLQFLILFACTITFGLLPPLQPFSCLPVSHSTLKYTVILSGLSYPIGCSIALFFKCKSLKILTLLSLLAAAICVFIFYSALHSPDLPVFLSLKQQDAISSIASSNSTSGNSPTDYLDEYFEDEPTVLKRFLMHFNRNQSMIISIFMVSCWMVFNLTLSYVKTMVTIILSDRNGQEALFHVGLFSQLGSVLGSAFMFIAVNHLLWFKQK